MIRETAFRVFKTGMSVVERRIPFSKIFKPRIGVGIDIALVTLSSFEEKILKLRLGIADVPDITNSSERNNMLLGKEFDSSDDVLFQARLWADRMCTMYNLTRKEQKGMRSLILQRLFGKAGDGLTIRPPFHCDYGLNIYTGKGVYMNYDCIILDGGLVRIGDNTRFGPGVHIYTLNHKYDKDKGYVRNKAYAKPVTIGSHVWIGGGSIILPGVTIGDNTVIGAGAVVKTEIGPDCYAEGNPARVHPLK